jgi:predicted enzyme related to lactoylglutathione lyase
MHLDLRADDPPHELQRLTDLGATVTEHHEHWVQLADPEGNEFCLMTFSGS